jgi:hypothetical protein
MDTIWSAVAPSDSVRISMNGVPSADSVDFVFDVDPNRDDDKEERVDAFCLVPAIDSSCEAVSAKYLMTLLWLLRAATCKGVWPSVPKKINRMIETTAVK